MLRWIVVRLANIPTEIEIISKFEAASLCKNPIDTYFSSGQQKAQGFLPGPFSLPVGYSIFAASRCLVVNSEIFDQCRLQQLGEIDVLLLRHALQPVRDRDIRFYSDRKSVV